MGMIDEFGLSSEATARMKMAIEGRIAEISRQLESPEMTDRDTAMGRGAIRELRSILAARPPHVAPLRYSGNHRGIE